MATATLPTPMRTLADLLDHLGGIPPERVRLDPLPGTATEADVLDVEQHENRLCELIDGVLVEKPEGYRESLLAAELLGLLREFVKPRNRGLLSGPDGMMRLFPGLVRIPDVAFVSWERVPDRKVPDNPIPDLIPDLAVEVLSKSNTEAEMARKLSDYFSAGVRLVWFLEPETRTASVHTQPGESQLYKEEDNLLGEPVLPEFSVSLRDLFAELDREGT